MRLICPNCDAQYEVDDSVIPQSGRDVQCSNCGHAWFQAPATALPDFSGDAEPEPDDLSDVFSDDPTAEELATMMEAFEDDVPAPAKSARSDTPAPSAPDLTVPDLTVPDLPAAPPPVAASSGVDFDDDHAPDPVAPVPADMPDAAVAAPAAADVDEAEEDAPAPTPAALAGAGLQRRTLDDAVLSVLREEAARETQARASEGSGIEMQPELGLPAAMAKVAMREEQSRERIARLRDDAEDDDEDFPDEDGDDYGGKGSRRDLLPDIEEINSTLRATSDRRSGGAQGELDQYAEHQARGFRYGFSSVVAASAVLVLVYVLAPQITTRVPAVAPAVGAYVSVVNQGRLWLDRKMQDTITSIKGSEG